MSNDPSTSTDPAGLSQADCPTEILPTVAPIPTRRPILRPGGAAHAPAAAQPGRSPFAGWRGQASTEELPAVSAPRRRNRPARRPAPVRHLRAVLTGALLAIVAISGLSAYAAQGITDARQAALNHARPHVSAPR